MRISGAALLIAVLAAACSTASLTLPTDPGWHDPAGGCRGVGLDGILRGSANDPRVLWMEDRATGERVELIWPAGYHARDDFGLEVLDDSGTFVGKEGDLVTGACITGAPGEAMHVWAGELKAAP